MSLHEPPLKHWLGKHLLGAGVTLSTFLSQLFKVKFFFFINCLNFEWFQLDYLLDAAPAFFAKTGTIWLTCALKWFNINIYKTVIKYISNLHCLCGIRHSMDRYICCRLVFHKTVQQKDLKYNLTKQTIIIISILNNYTEWRLLHAGNFAVWDEHTLAIVLTNVHVSICVEFAEIQLRCLSTGLCRSLCWCLCCCLGRLLTCLLSCELSRRLCWDCACWLSTKLSGGLSRNLSGWLSRICSRRYCRGCGCTWCSHLRSGHKRTVNKCFTSISSKTWGTTWIKKLLSFN